MKGARCQTCNNLVRQRRNARKLGDGLTPQERAQKVRKGWAWPKNFYHRSTPGGDGQP